MMPIRSKNMNPHGLVLTAALVVLDSAGKRLSRSLA